MSADRTDLLNDLIEAQKKFDAARAQVRGIRADHSVPLNRLYRQWDTRGQLWLWINPGILSEFPRVDPAASSASAILNPFFGIPIYSEQGGTL